MSAVVMQPIVMTCDRCKASTPIMFVPGMAEAVKQARACGWRQDEHTETYMGGADPDPETGFVPAVMVSKQCIVWDETVCPDCVKAETKTEAL